jgi:ribonuclease D
MKIMHGSDNDLCVIRSVLKLNFLNFLDTARIDVEIRKQQNIRGLATLVKEYLKEHMSKDYQVSEWRIRPIPSSMIDYARRDPLVLPFLTAVMLHLLPLEELKEVLIAGCRHARKNKKTSQPLIKSIQTL